MWYYTVINRLGQNTFLNYFLLVQAYFHEILYFGNIIFSSISAKIILTGRDNQISAPIRLYAVLPLTFTSNSCTKSSFNFPCVINT
jgi:hypothetical protein